jgi:hypothetical protein
MREALGAKSEFSRPEIGSIEIAVNQRGWVMFTRAEWIAVGLAAVTVAAAEANCFPRIGPAPWQSDLVSQSKMVSQASMVDRSGKGDRLVPVAPAITIVLPVGCEFPFSGPSKLSRSDALARCVT